MFVAAHLVAVCGVIEMVDVVEGEGVGGIARCSGPLCCGLWGRLGG